MNNYMKLEFDARAENESFARVCVAAFAARLDPTLEEISDIKTALSEAVTNAIIHGYEGIEDGRVTIEATIEERCVHIAVKDSGKGIADITRAMEPLYTGQPEMERSGMGFTVMEAFMDSVEVCSRVGEGTEVLMSKCIYRK